jgi:hypothetical protein
VELRLALTVAAGILVVVLRIALLMMVDVVGIDVVAEAYLRRAMVMVGHNGHCKHHDAHKRHQPYPKHAKIHL